MACNEDLQAEGKPYPRTCADCGLGPCKKKAPSPTTPVASSEAFAALILAMNYGLLLEVGGELSSMIEDGVRDRPKTAHDFASILFDWAEAR